MTEVRAALTIALKDLRERLRDRSFFIYGVAAPLAIAFVFSLILGPLTGRVESVPTIGLVSLDATAVGAGLRTALGAAQSAGVITWRELPDAAAAAKAVAAGDVGAAVVVPAGFGEAVGRSPTELQLLTAADATYAAKLATAVADAYLTRVRATAWATNAVAARGDAVVPALLALQLAAAPLPLQLEPRPTSARQLDVITYYAAGMAAFFVFFIVQLGVAGLLDEEKDGTLTRLLAAPISRHAVLGGKVLGSVAIGVLSLLVLWGASSLIMGARWGQPLGVLLLALALVAAAAGVLMLVAGVARTSEAAGNVQSMVAIVLGALGGVFMPLAGSGLIASLSRLSPHYWYLRGLADLAGTGSVAAVLPDLAAILAFAALAGGVGWALLGRRLER